MGNAGVDDRFDAKLDQAHRVQPDRQRIEVERRKQEVRIAGDADVGHGSGDVHGVGEAAGAQEADHARRRGHGATAPADRLGDRAVANVRVPVCFVEAGKVDAAWRVDRRGEPAIAGAAQADAEAHPVARHGGHHRASLDRARRVDAHLAIGHGNVQEELLGRAQEAQDLGTGRRRHVDLLQPGCDRAQEERAGGDIALVELVAHGDRPSGDGAQIDAARGARGGAQRRAEHIPHPDEPVDHVRPVGAEAQHAADALVQDAVAAITAGAVLDHEHRHARRRDAAHRADRARVVAWAKRDLAGRRLALGFGGLFRPAFVDRRAGDGTAHRAGHLVPDQRRTGMEQDLRVLDEHRHRPGGGHDVDQPGLGVDQLARHGRVRLAEGPVRAVRWRRLDGPQHSIELRVAVGRRAPVHADQRRAGGFDGGAKTGDAQGDHAHPVEQTAHRVAHGYVPIAAAA